MAESLEVRALRQYALDARLSHRVTSTCRIQRGSRHGAVGTSGCGLAADFAGSFPAPNGSPELTAIAVSFLAVAPKLHELIYTPLGFSIRNGRRVPPIAADFHFNHVHVSVDKETFVAYPEVVVPDDPNVPNLTDIKFFVPVVGVDPLTGRPVCDGYYMVSSTGEVHAHGPGAVFHGRSEVVTP